MNSRIPEPTPVSDGSIVVRSLLASCGIAGFMAMTGATEVAVNRPFEVWTESRDGWVRHDAPKCSFDVLMKLGNALAVFNKAKPPLSSDAPIKPVRLPDGERGQLVIAPACEPGTVSMTIRIPSAIRFTVRELVETGYLTEFVDVSPATPATRPEALEALVAGGRLSDFDDAPVFRSPAAVHLEPFELEMLEAKRSRDILTFLELAVRNGLNIVLVGGTGSAKTTLTKALADLVPSDERIATIEDTHELPLPYHPNHVHLFYSEALPAREIVKTTLRMKFDRVYLAELRGDETWDYLSLLNTGHRGGLTTVHANDAASAPFKIATLVKQSQTGQTLDWDLIMRIVNTTIDVVLFMKNKRLKQVYFDPARKRALLAGVA